MLHPQVPPPLTPKPKPTGFLVTHIIQQSIAPLHSTAPNASCNFYYWIFYGPVDWVLALVELGREALILPLVQSTLGLASD